MEVGATTNMPTASKVPGGFREAALIATAVTALAAVTLAGVNMVRHDTRNGKPNNSFGAPAASSSSSSSSSTSTTKANTSTTKPENGSNNQVPATSSTTEQLSARPNLLVATTADNLLVQLNSKSGKVDHVILNSDQVSHFAVESNLMEITGDWCTPSPNIALSASTISLDRIHDRVYFDVTGTCMNQAIMSVKTDGSNVRVEEKYGAHPAVNAQGTQLAYTAMPNYNDTNAGPPVTYIRNLATGESRPFVDEEVNDMSWSSDGKSIAVQEICYEDCRSEVVVLDASKHYKDLTKNLPVKFDRNKISGIANSSTMANGFLFTVRNRQVFNKAIDDVAIIDPVTGTEQRVLATGKDTEMYNSPSVSKDSQHFLFTSFQYIEGKPEGTSIYNLYVVDGSGIGHILAQNIVAATW